MNIGSLKFDIRYESNLPPMINFYYCCAICITKSHTQENETFRKTIYIHNVTIMSVVC